LEHRRISEFFKGLDMTEGRSTGIPKIIKAMKENGSPPPEFEFDADYSYFMVTLPIHQAVVQIKDQPDGHQVTPQVTLQVTPQVEKLLRSIEGELSRTEIMSKIHLKDRMNFAFSYLQPAIEGKLIEMTIPDKPTSRNQKYRLTENGRKYLENR
jgi:ATP-dependent DNA helicase RecG